MTVDDSPVKPKNAPATKAGQEGAAIPKTLPPLEKSGIAPAGSELFGAMPYHSIGCDCSLHLARNSRPGK